MAHAKEERAVRVLLATTSPQKQEAVERAFVRRETICRVLIKAQQLWKRPVELHAFKVRQDYFCNSAHICLGSVGDP